MPRPAAQPAAPQALQTNLAALPALSSNAGGAAIGGPFGPPVAQVAQLQLQGQLQGLPVTYFKPPSWHIFGLAVGGGKAIDPQEAALRLARGEQVRVQGHGQPLSFELRNQKDVDNLQALYRPGAPGGSAGVLKSQQDQGVEFLLADGRKVDAHGAYRVLHDHPDQAVRARKPTGIADVWGVGNLHHAGLMKDWMGTQTEQVDSIFQNHPNPAHGLFEMARHEQLDFPRLYQALEGIQSQHPNAAGWVSYTRSFTENLQANAFRLDQVGEALAEITKPAGEVDLGTRLDTYSQIALAPHMRPEESLALYRVFARGCQSGCSAEALKQSVLFERDRLHRFPPERRGQHLSMLEREAAWPDRLMHTLNTGAPPGPPPGSMQAERVRPLEVKGPPGSGSAPINAAVTFRMNLPELGWTVSKLDNHSTRTHIEVLASKVDELLPVPPGGSERVVPTTVPVRLEAAARGESITAPPGLYSAQQFVPDCVELQTLIERGAVPEKPHPDFQRMRYLDMLMANRDRHPWNVLMDGQGRPHAIDNGYGMSTEAYYLPTRVDPKDDYLHDYVNYNNIGWRPFAAVSDQAAPQFLRDSLQYAHQARQELTDEKLESLVDSMRPLYPHVADWHHVLDTMKFNRDHLPETIHNSLRNRGVTP